MPRQSWSRHLVQHPVRMGIIVGVGNLAVIGCAMGVWLMLNLKGHPPPIVDMLIGLLLLLVFAVTGFPVAYLACLVTQWGPFAFPGTVVVCFLNAGVWGLTAFAYAKRTQARQFVKEGRCTSCGYDLRGSAAATSCPECGNTSRLMQV